MASPPIPPALGHLAGHPFSFYPAIRGIEQNEWIFRKVTWPELVVVNRKSGEEISIPRQFIGEVSLVDDPVVIVGLVRELEYRGGLVVSCQSRVIEMPMAVGGSRPAALTPRPVPAPVVAIRLEAHKNRRVYKLAGGFLAAAILLFLAAATLLHLTLLVFNARNRPASPMHHSIGR